MRKIYKALGVLALAVSSMFVNAQVNLTEDFNATGTPPGWTVNGFARATVLPCEGAGSMRRNFWSSAQTGSITSPTQTATGFDIDVEFTYKVVEYDFSNPITPQTGNWGSLVVEYSINGGTDWITHHTIDETNHVPSGTCAPYNFTLPGVDVPTGSDFRFRLSGQWLSGDYYVYFDEFSMFENVPCPGVTGLTASNIDLTTADLSWTSGAANFNIEWSTSPFTPGADEEGSATSATNSYSFSGLTQGTTYYVSVQADCGVVDGVSSWSTPIQFTTPIPGATCEVALPIASLPFSATDNTSNYGDNYNGSPGATGCGTTGPYLGGDDVVYSFTADFDGVVNLSMTPTAAWSGVFVYESCANIGVACYAGEANSGTGIRTFDFNVIDGNTYYIVISTNPTPQSTAYTLTLTQITCPDPSGLTLDGITASSADISWTAGGTESNWNIEWGAPGFTPGTGAAIDSDVASSESFTITDLTAETNYDVYVQADCGATDGTSEWVGPLNVFTGYCTAGPTSTTDSEILGVTLNGAASSINNTTPCPAETGVQNFTAQSVILVRGETYDLDVLMGTCGGSYTNTIKAWVDYNQDLELEEPAEQLGVLTQDASAAGVTGTLTFTVPLTANLGETRLRVMMRETTTASSVTPCASYSWGSAHDYTVEIIDAPATPPAPVQDAAAPTCVLGTDLTVTGTPDAGIVWYWQESATGTATDNLYDGAYTVFANGTYYLRAYDAVYDLWSDASSVTVSNFPLVADLPPAPVAGANPVCLPGTEISMPAPDAGFEFYWQTIENGTSTANNADTPWEITATGTYYVATLETATNCWSETSEITVTVDTYVPSAPSVTESVYNICAGETSQEIEAIAQADGTVNVTIGTNVNWTSGTSVLTSNLDLPAGAVVNSASIVINGVTTTGITFLNDLTLSSTGAVVLSSTTLPGASTATNAGPFSYPVTVNGSGTFTVTLVNAWSSLATAQSILLEVNYDLPSADIAWYDAAMGGSEIGTGSPFEAIGTSVMNSPAESGVYEFYAGSTSGACISESRTLVTINVNAVNVMLSPIDVTCNGGNDGSFEVASIECGAEPFTFSVDGGAFGAIPADLTAGTYSIVVRDANNDESSAYTVVIGQPETVTDVVAEAISFEEVELSWNTVGSESQWVVEYGEAGFTPGSGTTVTVDENPAIVSGLNSSTTYDFYIRSLCAEGFEGDNSAVASATTLASCGDTVYDNGGEDGNYLANSNEVVVICPQNEGDYVQLDFLSFETEEAYDGMYVFNGSDITSPLIASENPAGGVIGSVTQPGAYWGSEIPGPFFATNEDGCLTVQFLSDGLFEFAGFEYTISCYPVELTPGVDGAQDVCRLDGTIDLFDVITAGNDFGTWSFDANPGQLNGSILNIAGLPSGTFTAEYTVINAYDTTVTVATINVFGPSNAGISGNIETCNYGPLNLFDGLSGTVDLGGTWYGPNGNAIAGNTVNFNGQIAAEYEYIYVTSNEVCPADTATVLVQLQDCANIAENEIQGFALYPNPTADVINIQYTGVNISTDVILSDAKGAIVYAEKVNFNSDENFTIDMSKLVKGIYFLNIYSEDASKVVRVVKN